MHRISFASLRLQLPLLVLLAMLPVLVVAGYHGVAHYRREVSEAKGTALQLARLASISEARRIEIGRQHLAAMARQLPLEREQAARCGRDRG